jgi:hypothetical protein
VKRAYELGKLHLDLLEARHRSRVRGREWMRCQIARARAEVTSLTGGTRQ